EGAWLRSVERTGDRPTDGLARGWAEGCGRNISRRLGAVNLSRRSRAAGRRRRRAARHPRGLHRLDTGHPAAAGETTSMGPATARVGRLAPRSDAGENSVDEGGAAR